MKSTFRFRNKCVAAIKDSIDGLNDLHGPVHSSFEVYGQLMYVMDDLRKCLEGRTDGVNGEDLCNFLLEIAGHSSRAIIDLNLTKFLGEPFESES